jgi:hypothetical protein
MSLETKVNNGEKKYSNFKACLAVHVARAQREDEAKIKKSNKINLSQSS